MKRAISYLISVPFILVIVICGGLGLVFEGAAICLACFVDKITGYQDDKSFGDLYDD